jgi:uncharacterized protein YciU (UPF0263 family)
VEMLANETVHTERSILWLAQFGGKQGVEFMDGSSDWDGMGKDVAEAVAEGTVRTLKVDDGGVEIEVRKQRG